MTNLLENFNNFTTRNSSDSVAVCLITGAAADDTGCKSLLLGK
jgi:hypothetical protein